MTLPEIQTLVRRYLLGRGGKLTGSRDNWDRFDMPHYREDEQGAFDYTSYLVEYHLAIGTISLYSEIKAPGHDPVEILSKVYP